MEPRVAPPDWRPAKGCPCGIDTTLVVPEPYDTADDLPAVAPGTETEDPRLPTLPLNPELPLLVLPEPLLLPELPELPDLPVPEEPELFPPPPPPFPPPPPPLRR